MTNGSVPVEIVQTLFFMLDPFTAERKFTRFAALDPSGDEARSFVALEDWINDGVPLAARAARDCARSLVRRQRAGARSWQIGGRTVDPKQLQRARDRRRAEPRPDRPAEFGRATCRRAR